MSSRKPNDSRGVSRRASERRKSTRRVIEHAFGTEKWIRSIQAEYLLWPKEDRRRHERRLSNRREVERRVQLRKYRRNPLRYGVRKHPVDKPILTAEEKNMLNDLYTRF